MIGYRKPYLNILRIFTTVNEFHKLKHESHDYKAPLQTKSLTILTDENSHATREI